MDGRDVPLDAPLALDQLAVLERFLALVPVAGRRVLEIGGCAPAAAPGGPAAAAWYSVDPRNTPAERGALRVIEGRAERLPLPDASVDAVFSCNCFQHVERLEDGLREIGRVLVRGGVLYANFGPIWSAPDGAHVEAFVHDGRRYDFWTVALLPAWAQLVFDADELQILLSAVHGRDLAAATVDWLERSGWTNRLTLRDHARLVEASGLTVLRFAGTTEFGYPFAPPAPDHPLMRRLEPGRLAHAAEARYGLRPADLHVRDLEIVLQKR